MKTLAGLFFAAASVFAGMPDAAVRVELQILHVSEAQALDLIPRLSRPETATAAFADLQTLCHAGKANRAALLIATGFTGSETFARSTEEGLYSIARYKPDPRLLPITTGPDGKPYSVPYPVTDFGKRDTGVKLGFQLQKMCGEHGLVLALTTENTLLEKRERMETGVSAFGTKTYVETPVFLVRETTTTLIMAEGVPSLMGVFKLPESKGVFELHIVTASPKRMDAMPVAAAAQLNPQWRVEMQRFRLSQAEALELRARSLSPDTVESAFASLIQMAKEGRAELCEWTTLPMAGGCRPAAWRNTREVWCAIEDRGVGMSGWVKPEEFSERFPFFEFSLPFDPPTAHEIRNLGDALEVHELSPGSGGAVSLTLNKAINEMDGYLRWATGVNFQGQRALLYQPRFQKRSAASTFELLPGRRQLYSFQNLSSGGRCEMTFIQIVENPVPAPSPSK